MFPPHMPAVFLKVYKLSRKHLLPKFGPWSFPPNPLACSRLLRRWILEEPHEVFLCVTISPLASLPCNLATRAVPQFLRKRGWGRKWGFVWLGELLSEMSEEKYGSRKLSVVKVIELKSLSGFSLTQLLLCGHESATLQALGQAPWTQDSPGMEHNHHNQGQEHCSLGKIKTSTRGICPQL